MKLTLGDIINGEVAYVGVGDQAGTIWVMREVQKYMSEMERMPVGDVRTVERDGVLIIDNQEEASPLQHAHFSIVCATVSLQNSIRRGGDAHSHLLPTMLADAAELVFELANLLRGQVPPEKAEAAEEVQA